MASVGQYPLEAMMGVCRAARNSRYLGDVPVAAAIRSTNPTPVRPAKVWGSGYIATSRLLSVSCRQ